MSKGPHSTWLFSGTLGQPAGFIHVFIVIKGGSNGDVDENLYSPF